MRRLSLARQELAELLKISTSGGDTPNSDATPTARVRRGSSRSGSMGGGGGGSETPDTQVARSLAQAQAGNGQHSPPEPPGNGSPGRRPTEWQPQEQPPRTPPSTPPSTRAVSSPSSAMAELDQVRAMLSHSSLHESSTAAASPPCSPIRPIGIGPTDEIGQLNVDGEGRLVDCSRETSEDGAVARSYEISQSSTHREQMQLMSARVEDAERLLAETRTGRAQDQLRLTNTLDELRVTQRQLNRCELDLRTAAAADTSPPPTTAEGGISAMPFVALAFVTTLDSANHRWELGASAQEWLAGSALPQLLSGMVAGSTGSKYAVALAAALSRSNTTSCIGVAAGIGLSCAVARTVRGARG